MEVGKDGGGDARTEHTLGHTREYGREGPRCMREREQRGSWTRTEPGGSPSQPRRSALEPYCPFGPVPEEPRRHTWPEQHRRANERGVQRALSAKSGRLSGSVRRRGVGNDAALRAAPSNVLSLPSLFATLTVCSCHLSSHSGTIVRQVQRLLPRRAARRDHLAHSTERVRPCECER